MAVTLYDAYGRPIDLAALKPQKAAASITGVRQPYSGHHPAAGLTPPKLARMLREAIDGDPSRYLELAEDMEERDLHYVGVLGIRKRQVARLDITVEAISEDPRDVAAADLVREFIARDTLADELIDILDAVGKGFSITEIGWDTSEGQWRIDRLSWRDPRFFEFAREDYETPLRREAGGPVPLEPAAFVTHFAKVKSGLPIRGGLARAAAWAYIFKSFTLKDWAIFCEAYGQPLRVGKYADGALDTDKDTLLHAVQSIGADYAAIIPASMSVEFIKADIAGSHELYEKRADWLDRQVSKAILGQVGTTDAIAGGYAVGKVHDGVREDIEEADARQLAATLNRDIVRPLCQLNFGPLKRYPRIKIGRPDEVDIAKVVENVARLVPLGLKVGAATMRDLIGIPEPDADEELLGAPKEQTPPEDQGNTPPPPGKRPELLRARPVAPPPEDAIDRSIAEQLGAEGWAPLLEPLIAGLEHELAGAADEADATRVLAAHLGRMGVDALAQQLARAAFSARLAGEADDELGGES